MTFLNVTYRYGGELGPEQTRALADAFAVYGIRAMSVDETDRTITIEYDATRLSNDLVAAILRRCQVRVEEKIEPKVLA